jgi:competence protein ComEC
MDSLDINENIIKSYVIGSGVNAIVKKSTKSNLYVFDKEVIFVVDSLGIYMVNAIKPTMVLLQHSPKINMERLLYELHPKLVIADGSNYKSFTEKWKETCLKNKTPFFSTAENGAFILKE